MEFGWERDVEIHKGWDLCLCGGGGDHGADGDHDSVGGRGGGSVDGNNEGGGVDGSGGNVGVHDGRESIVYRCGGDGLSVVHWSVEDGLCRSD